MGSLCKVAFRGEQVVVVIEFDEGTDYETKTRVISWYFRDLNKQEHIALGITPEEESDVFEQLVECQCES